MTRLGTIEEEQKEDTSQSTRVDFVQRRVTIATDVVQVDSRS